MPAQRTAPGPVYTHQHNAFKLHALAVLNVAAIRWPMSAFRPRPACSRRPGARLPDHGRVGGIELFLKPDEECLVARDGQDCGRSRRVVSLPSAPAPSVRPRSAAYSWKHTYAHRGEQVNALWRAN
jgi:hypothetical protein